MNRPGNGSDSQTVPATETAASRRSRFRTTGRRTWHYRSRA